MNTSEWVFGLNGRIECKHCGYYTGRSPTPYCPYCGYFMTNNEKVPCEAYISYYYDERPHCMGTREIELCNCGGDKRKCNFYPELRSEQI